MALCYFRNVGTDWNTASNWSLTDGGGATGAVPTISDDVFFTANSGNCTMGANRICKSINFTGYTNQLTVATFILTVQNDITFQANQASRIVGTTGTLAAGASGTITSNGGTWPLNFTINNVGSTNTLADDLRIGGSYSVSGGTRIVNGFNMYVGGSFTSGSTHVGTTNFIMDGTGTYSGGAQCNLEVNTTGSIIITGTVIFTRRFIITAAGSITMTAANVTIRNTTTVDLGGRTVGNLTHSFSATGIISYLSDVYCSNFSIGNGSSTYNGPGKIFASGNYVLGASSGSLVVELVGSGSISTGTLGLACIINTVGTYTMGATLTIANSFTRTAGNLDTTGSTVTLLSGTTMTTAGILWNILVVTSGTITINSLLSASELSLPSNQNITFNGIAGFSVGTLTYNAPNFTLTLQHGVTYTVTGTMTLLGSTDALRLTINSSDYNFFSGTVIGTNLSVSGAVTGNGITVGQSLSHDTGSIPIGLFNLLPSRPTIISGSGLTWTLDLAVSPSISSAISLGVGRKAILTFTGITQNVGFVTTRGIDSSLGNTIYAFNSENDVNMFRTLNWNTLSAPVPGNFGKASFG